MESARADLEFDKVIKRFASHSLSSDGRAALLEIETISDIEKLKARRRSVGALKRILESGYAQIPERFPDISTIAERITEPLFSPEGVAIYDVGLYIRSASSLFSFCHTRFDDNLPLEDAVCLAPAEVGFELDSVRQKIFEYLESDGSIKQTHPRIRSIVSKIESTTRRRGEFARSYIVKNRSRMQSDSASFRDKRVVLQMRSDRISGKDGYILSSSRNGATLYVEPFALVELNNSVQLAEEELYRELAAIRKELCTLIRSHITSIESLREKVAELDMLYALACSARAFGMVETENRTDRINLIGARHPLLGKKAVPVSVVLSPEIRAVVFSGPNAGGKTVTMKTVGLLALINQISGFIPAESGSFLPVFTHIYTAIGDEQSILEGISTFSGHMKRIASIIDSVEASDLVILDELGSGTDPAEGSAIARAVTERCLESGALTLISSHHALLKQFAYERDDLMNASMAFDEKNHHPTFRVVAGVPGESHAIDTARNVGMDPRVVERAKSYLDSGRVKVGELIRQLEDRREQMEKQKQEIDRKQKALDEKVRQLEKQKKELSEELLRVTEQQDTTLGRFMRQKSSELETLVKQIQMGELTAEKRQNVKRYISSLQQKKEATEKWIDNQSEKIVAQSPEHQFKAGEKVLCGRAKREGVVLKTLKGGKVQVAIGAMKMTLKARELQLAKPEEPKVRISYTGSTPKPVMVMDVRGLTLRETLHRLDLQMEAALVHNLTQFSVIHGYGDGVLSRGIGEYLKKHPAVKDFRFAMPEDGGMGKTYIFL